MILNFIFHSFQFRKRHTLHDLNAYRTLGRNRRKRVDEGKVTQTAFTCSKLQIKTLVEQDVKYVQG